MSGFSQLTVSSSAPFVWSLVLSFGMLMISIILLYIARFNSRLQIKDLAALRSMFDRFPAWGKRASWAQQNSFEAFTIHAPAALLALVAVLNNQSLPSITVVAALAHPAFRVVYISAYLFNVPIVRSLAWFLGLFCSGLLYAAGLDALVP